MVQVRSRKDDGSINTCRIHDLMRDLAIQKAEEDNFLMVYSHPDNQSRVSKARRVAIHHQSDCLDLSSQTDRNHSGRLYTNGQDL